jgi:hypothetical protein
MAAITADLKTKDLSQRIRHSLLSTSFMKLRGPEALKHRWELSDRRYLARWFRGYNPCTYDAGFRLEVRTV